MQGQFLWDKSNNSMHIANIYETIEGGEDVVWYVPKGVQEGGLVGGWRRECVASCGLEELEECMAAVYQRSHHHAIREACWLVYVHPSCQKNRDRIMEYNAKVSSFVRRTLTQRYLLSFLSRPLVIINPLGQSLGVSLRAIVASTT